MPRDPQVYHLDNGLTVIHQRIPHSRLVHCGFIVNAGTRDENPDNNGVAHFIEHATFKGTRKRKPYHILNRIETVGGELEAFTTREKTFYFTSSLSKYADRSIELLTDLLFNATFPESEIEKEKHVIKEEIEMYEDIPEENIMDRFHEMMFEGHPLGYNMLGTSEKLDKLSRKQILDFLDQYYNTHNIIVSIAGNVTSNKVQKLINKHLTTLPKSRPSPKRKPPGPVKPFYTRIPKNFHQSHCIVGNKAYSRKDDKRYAFAVLNNLLGGSGMSARLNFDIREKYGYVYQIDSSFIPYLDTGVFTVEFSTDQNSLQKCIDLVFKAFRKLKQQKLGKVQLNRAKRQLTGNAALMEENHVALMQSHGRSYLDFGHVMSLEGFFERINSVKAEDILEVANEILDEDHMSVLVYESKE